MRVRYFISTIEYFVLGKLCKGKILLQRFFYRNYLACC